MTSGPGDYEAIVRQALDEVMETRLTARMLDTGEIDAARARAVARDIAEAVCHRVRAMTNAPR